MSPVKLKSLAARLVRSGLSLAIRVHRGKGRPVVLAPASRDALLAQRVQYYLGGEVPEIRERLDIATYFSGAPLGYLGRRRPMLQVRPATFYLDPLENPADGGDWIRFADYCAGHVVDVGSSRHRFMALLARLKARGDGRTYIFGTGPSLARALERDWSDGYRIVCNTMVRDPQAWKYLDPDIMVAGDIIYHFGFTEFAKAFRRDLRNRMTERPVPFVYPAQFDVIVQREFSDFAEWLVPVPIDFGKKFFLGEMDTDFSLPAVGNVLNLLLLPIATTLSRDVALWGFDGRAPKDEGFWANSARHSYPELMHTLHEAHPAFFHRHVPKEQESRYVESVMGDTLEQNLSLLESRGWRFRMLHRSYTPTLAKRFLPQPE